MFSPDERQRMDATAVRQWQEAIRGYRFDMARYEGIVGNVTSTGVSRWCMDPTNQQADGFDDVCACGPDAWVLTPSDVAFLKTQRIAPR